MFSYGVITLSGGKWMKIDGDTADLVFALKWMGRRLPRPLEQKPYIESKIQVDRNVDNGLFYICTNFGKAKLKNQGARAKRAAARG